MIQHCDNPTEAQLSRECPAREQWYCFHHGHLPIEVAQPLGEHLEQCPNCRDILTSLGNGDDTVVGLYVKDEGQFESEPTCREARDRSVRRAAALSQWAQGAAPPAALGTSRTPENIPSQLGEYRLLESLGQGAIGRVFKAEHRWLKKHFAIKVLAPRQHLTPDLLTRFEREMEAAGQINHPHVIGATDAGESQGLHYLVMEYCEGFDLGTTAARLGWLSVADACEVVRQAALGIQAAHDRHLIHRDVKPSNLLLTERGIVKVLDLGLVALHRPADPGREDVARQVVGTRDYMAPEQWHGHAVDGRADVYGLGCTLFKLLTGRVPRVQQSAAQPVGPPGAFFQQHPKLSDIQWSSAIPRELVAVLARALAIDPADRVATAAELAALLAPFAKGGDLEAVFEKSKAFPLATTHHGSLDTTYDNIPSEDTSQPPQTSWHWGIAAMSGLAILGVAFLALAGYFVSRPAGPAWVACVADDLEPVWSESRMPPQVSLSAAADGPGIRLAVDDRTFVDVGHTIDSTYALRTSISLQQRGQTGMFFGWTSTGDQSFHARFVQASYKGMQGNQHRYVVTLRLIRFTSDKITPQIPSERSVAYTEVLLPPDVSVAPLEIRVSQAKIAIRFGSGPELVVRREQMPSSVGSALFENLAGRFGAYLRTGRQSFSAIQLLDY